MKRVLALSGLALAVALAASGAGAGAASGACPESNPPNELVLADGSGQQAQLGKQFAQNLQVELANTNGCPLTGNLAGSEVTFDAPGTGPSGLFAGSGSHEAVVGTNGQGIATAPAFTANFSAGAYTVDVHSAFGNVELQLSNTAGGLAASIAPTGGTPQAAAVNSRYAQPLQARVADANGNPVQGATVSFSIAVGPTGAGAGFPGGGQATATTDSNGLATSPPLLANGSPGRFTAVASTDGVTAVAGYSLDNHAAASTLSAVGSTAQSATIDSRYARPLTARLLDPDGQPIEGAAVTFTLGAATANGGDGASGASFLGGAGQATILTDPNGIATTPPILANAIPGAFTATATVAGSTAHLTFTLLNLAARLVARDSPRSATVEHGYSHALAVRVRGAGGKPLEGLSVTFAIGKASNNASASFPDGTSQATATTNSAGVATAPTMTANSVAGSFEATATLAGSKPISFTLQNRAGQPNTIATGAADGTSTTIGSPLPIRLAVTVTDKDGNPVPGLLVRFTAPSHGPGGRFTIRAHPGKHSVRTARVRTNANGIAIAPSFTANRSGGGYTVGVRAGARQAAFALVNRP
jgi:protocatechuate 3,4-dioxygenase beta subunit